MKSDDFRCKSFLIELIVAKLLDDGQDLSDYPEAMQAFFTYIIRTGLKELISFNDFTAPDLDSVLASPIRVIDPVNATNNVAVLYTEKNREALIAAANEAGDAIDGAISAMSKEKATYYWKKVFGPSFTTGS